MTDLLRDGCTRAGRPTLFPNSNSKQKNFETDRLKKGSVSKKGLTSLEIETLYWKAQVGKPFYVQYGNDMPGSAFDEPGGGCGGVKKGKKEVSDVMTVCESQWNMRRVARADGSLLKFLKEEIPGVTSPMVYMGMLYSWFAWHVEDHDLHSLNYMHMGAGKTWYGVPLEAAFAFEEAIRTEGYGGDMSPTVTFATLGKKTTIVSPEVLVKAGVPCCRLVQNTGEFVVTFPRAYHSGFSHGFNCAEAVNFATPVWLTVAREAAIRRVSVDIAPMISDTQLMYDLALSVSSSKQKSSRTEPQSSRLRDKLKFERDAFLKRTFMHDVMHSNELLDLLGNGSPITILSQHVLKSLVVSGINLNFDNVVDRRPKKRLYSSYDQPNKKADPASIFSCVTCGSPCYSCVAIVQPTETAAHYLKSNEKVKEMDTGLSSGKLPKNSLTTGEQKETPALHLLGLAYGGSSDSEEDSESTKFVMKWNPFFGTFEYAIETPSAIRKSSLIGSGPMFPACERDSSRMHVFCLEHAREVERRLQPVGGVRMLLLCHQDYHEINDAARLVSKELGISDDMWTNVGYTDVTEQDKTIIQWALDDEETATGNQVWAVKLGVDIFYSARLGGSPFYKRQMPYNSVIYNAFQQKSPSDDETTPDESGGQKKTIVAGRWCGKVWMFNQVNPLLTVRDDDKQEEDHETVSVLPKTNVNHEKQLVVRKKRTKRKRSVNGKFLELEASPPPLPPADSPQNSGYRRQKTSKARNVVDKKAQQSDMDSGDEKPEEGEIVGEGNWHDVVNKRNRRRPPPTKLQGKRRITQGRRYGKILRSSCASWNDLDLSHGVMGILVNHGDKVREEIMLQYKNSTFRCWIVEDEGTWAPDFLGGVPENPGPEQGTKGGSPEMEVDQQPLPEIVEETQVIGGWNPGVENVPIPGNNNGPWAQQDLGQHTSRVKRKRADLKKLRSNTLKPSKSLSKKVLPDLNLSNDVRLKKYRVRGVHLRKKSGKKGARDDGDDDLSQSEDWSEDSDEDPDTGVNSEQLAQDVVKEVEDTIKVGRGVGMELGGFENRVTDLVTGLVIQSGPQ
ncbi:hypothetical protein L1987_22918 [Smallanthus sonchifolius]|uniref:Uncharacterized protein n=1 Tax=Smallanthus sonchifolius TaxID=185202 RepID=A0ACB9IH41_9ASTR|nr:hypothetical protein L1987_22918 [Smallanthus sonchifolius]